MRTVSPWCKMSPLPPATPESSAMPNSLPRRARIAPKVSAGFTSSCVGLRLGEKMRTCILPGCKMQGFLLIGSVAARRSSTRARVSCSSLVFLQLLTLTCPRPTTNCFFLSKKQLFLQLFSLGTDQFVHTFIQIMHPAEGGPVVMQGGFVARHDVKYYV